MPTLFGISLILYMPKLSAGQGFYMFVFPVILPERCNITLRLTCKI